MSDGRPLLATGGGRLVVRIGADRHVPGPIAGCLVVRTGGDRHVPGPVAGRRRS